MHIQTHLMSGWCIGNCIRLSARQRLMCMIAASAADLDGLSILGGQNAYWEWHHVLGHNLAFGLLTCIVLAILSRANFAVFLLYLALFHLHLVMDFFGSGPGWPICYFWPFSHWSPDNRRWGWAFYSWQNISTALALLVWTIGIAVHAGRTPLEAIMPNLDRQLVSWLRAKFGRVVPLGQGSLR